MDNSSRTEKPTKTNKNKGGRPSKKQHLEHIAIVKPYWQKGWTAVRTRDYLETEKKQKFNLSTIYAYYQEWNEELENSKTKAQLEEELESRNRTISAVEEAIKFLESYTILLEDAKKLEHYRIDIWLQQNVDKETGKLKEDAAKPPYVRTLSQNATDLQNSIINLKKLIHEIQTAPLLDEMLEEKVAEAIESAKAKHKQ